MLCDSLVATAFLIINAAENDTFKTWHFCGNPEEEVFDTPFHTKVPQVRLPAATYLPSMKHLPRNGALGKPSISKQAREQMSKEPSSPKQNPLVLLYLETTTQHSLSISVSWTILGLCLPVELTWLAFPSKHFSRWAISPALLNFMWMEGIRFHIKISNDLGKHQE